MIARAGIRRVAVPLCSVALYAAALSPLALPSLSAQQPLPAAAPVQPASSLPLKEVVMFSSGVGFFERSAEVNGNATVNLQFDVADINDLLKSLVVEDKKGQVGVVRYTSRDPLTKTLKTFAVDLTTNPTMADLLNQVRGEKVEVSSPQPIVGTILGVERTQVPVKDQQLTVERLLLLTDEGLRTIDLANARQIRLLRPELEAELRQALLLLATGHDNNKKTVGLEFRGQGARQVRVGYIAESPIWKTSYRLVLNEDKSVLLQGWAIVENTSEEDWNDVQLTLVSGRPISFRMDLYQPLFVDRPLVEPELYASLRPQTYNEDLFAKEARFAEKAKADEGKGEGRGLANLAAAAPRDADRQNMLRRAAPGAPLAKQQNGMLSDYEQESVQSMAQATEVGELFRYVIATPVKIARRQSAMLPIVNETVTGEKVSIYNESVHAKHPLNGLQLKNSTGLNLMQGPLTVFDGGTYAGDAKIEDLSPGTERLISYAMDLDTEVAPEGKPGADNIARVKLYKGALFVERKAQRSRLYTVKNSGAKEKKVLIEYVKEPNWKLTSTPEPVETTRDRYRFAVAAKPGVATQLAVGEEQIYSQTIALTNMNDDQIRVYLNQAVVSDKVKAALNECIKLKAELNQVLRQKQQLEQEVAAIEAEQNRIRQNMPQLDRGSDLFSRYVKKFNEQEDRMEQVRGQIATLIKTEGQKRKALDDFFANLDLQ